MFRKKTFFLLSALALFGLITVVCMSFSNVAFAGNKEIKQEDIVQDLREILGIQDSSDGKIKVVTVSYDSEIVTHLTRGLSTTETLIDLGYPLASRNRFFSNSPIDRLYNETYVLIRTYTTEIAKVFVSIPFESITKGESLCSRMTEKRVEQKGERGKKVQTIEKYFLDGEYISEVVVDEEMIKEPVNEILSLSGGTHSPDSVSQIGPNCDYWESVIEKINATDEEKGWLKFTMKGESGCNAEHNRGTYKGLFQWEPCLWYKQYPKDNIFDGNAQIQRTLEKIRGCADPARMWPKIYQKYVNRKDPKGSKELSHRYVCGYL